MHISHDVHGFIHTSQVVVLRYLNHGKLRMLPPYAGYPSRSQIGNGDAAVFSGGWPDFMMRITKSPVVHFCCWLTGVVRYISLQCPASSVFSSWTKMFAATSVYVHFKLPETLAATNRNLTCIPALGSPLNGSQNSSSRAVLTGRNPCESMCRQRIWPVRAKETL